MESTLTTNTNFLYPTGFRLVVNKHEFANLEYFVTKCPLPGCSAGEIQVPVKNQKAYLNGDVSFDTFTCEFIVDERLKNYEEMFRWVMMSTVKNKQVDMTLIILGALNTKSREIKFKNCFPTGLTGIEFNTQTNGSPQPLTCSVTFRFDSFDILAEG